MAWRRPSATTAPRSGADAAPMPPVRQLRLPSVETLCRPQIPLPHGPRRSGTMRGDRGGCRRGARRAPAAALRGCGASSGLLRADYVVLLFLLVVRFLLRRDRDARSSDVISVCVRSSCRCSTPIARPSDSAERRSSDCCASDRRVGFRRGPRDARAFTRLAMPFLHASTWSNGLANCFRFENEPRFSL